MKTLCIFAIFSYENLYYVVIGNPLISLYFIAKTLYCSIVYYFVRFSDFFSIFHEEDMREEYMKS